MKTVRAFQARHKASTILEEAERGLLELAASLDAEAEEGGAINEAREKIMATYGGLVGLRCIVGFGVAEGEARKGAERYADIKSRALQTHGRILSNV